MFFFKAVLQVCTGEMALNASKTSLVEHYRHTGNPLEVGFTILPCLICFRHGFSTLERNWRRRWLCTSAETSEHLHRDVGTV